MIILIVLYAALGYWAVGATIYRNKIVFSAPGVFTGQKIAMGILLGWLLIPIALLMKLFGK